MFMVIDGEVMRSILSAPAVPRLPPFGRITENNRYRVKIVNQEYDQHGGLWFGEGEWDGSMKASIYDLGICGR